jgi:hydrogenase nickel incorporation protein HypA/HybF
MHELSLTKSILNTALRYAQKTDSRKIVTIALRLGILRDIKKEWVQHYFDYISRGTIAEGAEIMIMLNPIVCSCRDCGKEFEINGNYLEGKEIICPNCSTQNYTLISGAEFLIEGIEVI